MIDRDDLILLNVTYIKPQPKNNVEESFEIIYKDGDGKIYKSNEPANVDIYFVKPEYRDFSYNKPQEYMNRLEKRTVPYSKIRYAIAEEIGEEGMAFIKQCSQNNDWKALNRLYGWRYAFGCDFQPEFYFMREWYKKHKMDKNIKLTKAFLDIECDGIDFTTEMDQIDNSAYSPVNLVTLFLEDCKESHTFILAPYTPSKTSYSDTDEYNKRYKLYERQLKDHTDLIANMEQFIDQLEKEFSPVYGHIKYILKSYDKEIDLIVDLFRLIHDRKPNFCFIWNMRFDIQYLLERIKVLGYNPRSIMCHPDFNVQRCYFHVDKSTFRMEKQFDYFYCSSYTQYVCLMRLYASIRKSQQMLKSVSLNAIGDKELKDKKVEYPAEANIITFPYIDWKRFIIYNIKDVLLTAGIERKTNDAMTYYLRSHINLTPYSKIFRETHLLRYVREKYFNKYGMVQGNNINVIGKNEDETFNKFSSHDDDEDDDIDITFKGAINAEPLLNDYVGMVILGKKSNVVYQNTCDYDYESFYPTLKIISNMDPSTLLFKASFNNQEFISGEISNRSLNTVYFEKDKDGNTRSVDNTGEAVNTYMNKNILTFGYNYLDLPSIKEMYDTVKKELSQTK